jgi:AraC-like DNA-binding protein
MITELEEIIPEEGSSIRILVNPNLSDFYYWHFHPEIELVYIEKVNGIRHIGNHISKFKNGDMALIGSNIPHLNFDYGVKESYNKTVIQFLPEIISNTFSQLDEFAKINKLLKLAEHGLCFGEKTKDLIGKQLSVLHEKKGIAKLLELIKLLDGIAVLEDYTILHEKPFINFIRAKEQKRLKAVNAHIAENYGRKITLEEISDIAGLTTPAFCRYFKKMTKLTFSNFLNHYRIDIAKKLLLKGKNVSETCYETGFESPAYFNRIFKKVVQENPSSFQKRHRPN